MTMQCPQCGSSDTRTFEMAHITGSHSGQVRGGAYSPGGDIYFQAARIEFNSQLAQITAPPHRPKFRDGIMRVGIVFGMLAFFPSYFVIYFALPYLIRIWRFINFGQLSAGVETDFKTLSYLLLPFATVIFILITCAVFRFPGYKKRDD